MAGGKDSHRVRQYAQSRVRPRFRHVFRLHDHGKRYGARHLPTPRILCAVLLREERVHRFRLRHAERSRQSRRDAHPFRQPAEPLSLFLLFHRGRGVFQDNGASFRRGVRAHSPHLPLRQTRQGGARDPRSPRAARVEDGGVFHTLRALGAHSFQGVPVLCRARRRHRRAPRAGTQSLPQGGLRLAPHVLRFLRVFGQPLAHPHGADGARRTHSVFPVARRHRVLPGHQQRALRRPSFQIHLRLPPPPRRRQHRRARDPGGVPRQPHNSGRVSPPRSGTYGALSRAVQPHQLPLPRRPDRRELPQRPHPRVSSPCNVRATFVRIQNSFA